MEVYTKIPTQTLFCFATKVLHLANNTRLGCYFPISTNSSCEFQVIFKSSVYFIPLLFRMKMEACPPHSSKEDDGGNSSESKQQEDKQGDETSRYIF